MVLPCTRNDYGDVEVRTERLSKTLKTKGFFAELQKSLDQWSAEGVKGILFRIALKDASLVPILAAHGFHYHEVNAGQVTMARHARNWLTVSAIVVDRNGRILLTNERERKLKWTFPGGHVHNGEPLFETAKRKVADETGVSAEPQAIIALTHKVETRNSNVGTLIFYCLMRVDCDTREEQAELVPAPDGFSARLVASRATLSAATRREDILFREQIVAIDLLSTMKLNNMGSGMFEYFPVI
ncbi:hydrolase, NUDIX family [Ancylostoma ceylanicum]|uniref:Hydrolase, NUDIX family n=1 Tax=Ancylostoma ceylanicum TaxID=53326 RepID=A0A0D6M8G3_9BILA|nr:hydrolase, NUDIX family [Ancylostoma ceylanicum]